MFTWLADRRRTISGRDRRVSDFTELLARLEAEKGYERGPQLEMTVIVHRLIELGRPFELTIDGESVMIKSGPQSSPPKTPVDVLYITAIAGMVLGIAFILGGVALLALGGRGETTFELLGNRFSSGNVGVACVFCGAVFAIVTFRTLIKGIGGPKGPNGGVA